MINKKSTYQGWTNEKTWAAALIISNTKKNQDYFLDLVRLGVTEPDTFRFHFSRYYDWKTLNEFCSWAFNDNLLGVNWAEVINNLQDKINDGA